MEIAVTEKNGICIFGISGDIDLYSAPDLHRKYLDLTIKKAASPVIIDLQKTAYLDSSGIGVLVQILSDARSRKVPFYLCNIHGMVEKLFHLSRMSSILPIEKTLEQALEKIRMEK